MGEYRGVSQCSTRFCFRAVDGCNSLGRSNRETRVVLLLSELYGGGWSQLPTTAENSGATRINTAYAETLVSPRWTKVSRGYSDDGFDLIIATASNLAALYLK